jgi:hypothetical protein
MRSFMAQTTDLKKIAEGREAEMFVWGEGKILRLMRGSDAGQRAQVERDMLVLKGARESVRVPEVFEMPRPWTPGPRHGTPRRRPATLRRQPWKVWWVAGIGAGAGACTRS